MKFAVFALVSMYVIVQTCGNIIPVYPTATAYFRTVFNGRRFLTPQLSQSTSAHYYNNHQNSYKHKHNMMHSVSTTDSRKMIVPVAVPIVQYPVGSASYSAAAHSASSAAHRNQHSYNYQYARRNEDAVAEEEPAVEEVENVPTLPTCVENVSAEEEPSVEVEEIKQEEIKQEEIKKESNGEKYRKEICFYIGVKIESLIEEMSSEDLENFMNDFVAVVDNYCDFANLTE